MGRQLKIGMIDADLLDNGTRHPNLAQMKMSAYCKEHGHFVKLLFDDDLDLIDEFDALIVSKVFTYTNLPDQIQKYISKDLSEQRLQNVCIKGQIESLENSPPGSTQFMIGGTGFFENGGNNLHTEIEHHKPDYHLYDNYVKKEIENGRKKSFFDDYENYSIGFTTRGCFRKCDFCVNKKYEKAIKWSPVSEFLDDDRPMIYLWDDNFFAAGSSWEEILDDLISTEKPFQFRQGLDIRLMSEKKARRLSRCKYHGDFIFAFDHIEERDLIEKKLNLWKQHCRRTTKLYVLCAFDPINNSNFNTDFEALELKDIENTFERIKILMKYGCLPYIMRYDAYKQSKYRGLYTQIARWCNQPQFYKKMSFREFCEANEKYHVNEQTHCSAYSVLIDFENTHPSIAKKYFHLKFEDLNEFPPAEYGREKILPCETCRQQRITWQDVEEGRHCGSEIIDAYLHGILDFSCLENGECKVDQYHCAEKIASLLVRGKYSEILKILDNSKLSRDLDVSNIPQFSSIYMATHDILQILYELGGSHTYTDIGGLVDSGEIKTDVAKNKYGENHSKLITLMDLTFIGKVNRKKQVFITPMGQYFNAINEEERDNLKKKLFLRIPIIQRVLKDAKEMEVDIESILCTFMDGKTTRERRTSSILNMLKELSEEGDEEIQKRISRIH